MRVVLVGADFEENLGVGVIAAVARKAGHAVRIVTYDRLDQLGGVAKAVLGHRPHVVGLSMQFQHRAHDFLALARHLRMLGFRGHITVGGQFPSLAWRDVLQPENGVDTVVFNDGEQTFTDLLRALARGLPFDELPGLALRTADGLPRRTAGRPLNDDLDALPAPLRYRAPTRHLGIPFVPLMASRGCWGACTYCSITSTFRDARLHGGGRTFRERTPANVAAEMADQWHRNGGPCIYCFHDDNMLKPRPEDTLERLHAIRRELDARGVGRIGLIGKCRPDCVTPELARTLRELGVIRLYVGVENASAQGALHLNRARQAPHVDAALRACREAGIFVCYNLLLFEPDATLDDVAENIAFIRAHADHPVNFCRAEPYAGTPLMQQLAARGTLTGSYLGYDYRIADDRTELLFRISAAAFRQRNFDPSGVANRSMGLGYSQVVLEHFYGSAGPAFQSRIAVLRRRTEALTRRLVLETADFLDEAWALARGVDLADERDRERVERETALLGLRVAVADGERHAELDALYDALAALAREIEAAGGFGRTVMRALRGVAVGASLAAATVACEGTDNNPTSDNPDADSMVADPLPPDGSVDYMVSDPLPGDAGRADYMVVDPPPPDYMVVDPIPPDGGLDFMVVDPPPPDAGLDFMVVDPLPQDAGMDFMVVDPLPMDAGMDVMVGDPLPMDAEADFMVVDPLPMDAGMEFTVADPPPWDFGLVDPAPGDAAVEPDWPLPMDPPPPDHAMNAAPAPAGPPVDQWRDTTPRRAERTADLPLWAPPDLRLETKRVSGAVEVRILGAHGPASVRWEADGPVEGDGLAVVWKPVSDDQLRVAVRTKGGVGVLALRARDVRG